MAARSEETIGCASDEIVARRKTGISDSQSCCFPRQFNPCRLWSSFCSWFLRLVERFFACYGGAIAKHPLITIQICIILVSLCSVGFIWFQTENRTVKLFIPQSSQAIDDLDTAEKYFRLKIREEIVLLEASSDRPNVLEPDCLRQAFKAHTAVMGVESYLDFCATLSGNKSKSQDDCMMVNPLEFVQFNESKLDDKKITDVQQDLDKAFNDTALMRNGRPFRLSFNRMFGSVKRDRGSIVSAKALQMVYIMRDPSDEDENEKVLKWEKNFINKIASLEDELSCFKVHYSSERSLDDAIAESSGSDITLVSITFTLMISFASVMLGKFLNPLTGHSLLANAGVFAVALGIVAGFGVAMWFRVPFVSIVGVLPFLVLGIGIDDMFIMVDELDRQPRESTMIQTIKDVMKHSGATVTMTTMTDLVAFAVSTSTSFPAIKYFCIYAALTVTFSFLMIVTYFVAIMSFDVRRIKSGRRDCLPFCLAPRPKEGGPEWDEPVQQNSNLALKLWGTLLTHPVTKVVVICLSLALLGAGIYGVTQVDESFDRQILAKDDSYLRRFLSAEAKNFVLSIQVSIVESGDVDYEQNSTHQQIKELTNIVAGNKHYLNRSISWMEVFSQYAQSSGKNITGPGFLPELKSFLSIPDFAHFKQDLKFSEDGKKLEASRILGFMKNDGSSTFQKNAMLTLRDDIAEKSKLDAFPITRLFIFFEQYAITSRETIRNLIIAAVAVLVVTSPFLVDCTVTFIVVFNFAALICELFGLMVIWNVSLNSVSMINLVMAIGFAVDYSAHIAHAYITSNKETADERVVDALSTLGASVFMGGFSTFLGMVVLAFASSEIFRIFFRMFFGIVVLGLLHGLCIMPVHLSFLCWRPTITRPSSVEDSTQKLSSISKKDRRSKEADTSLRMQPVGSEETKSIDFTELNGKRSNNDHARQTDGTDGAQQVVNSSTVELGIENKGIELHKEPKNAKDGDKKQKNLSEGSVLDQEKDAGSISESPETLQSDQAANPVGKDTTKTSKTEEGSHDPGNEPGNATTKTGEVLAIAEKPPEAVMITQF